MTLEEYTFGLGKLVVNLHSLEFALRAFLWTREGGSSWRFLRDLQVGDTVPENAFTNYDSLGVLISKYNDVIGGVSAHLRLDEGLVNLRDTLAHGRVSSGVPEPPLRLLKFSRPSAGSVKVTDSILVDDAWLAAQTSRVRAELEKIIQAEGVFGARGSSGDAG